MTDQLVRPALRAILTPPEINAAAVGEFTRIAVLLSLCWSPCWAKELCQQLARHCVQWTFNGTDIRADAFRRRTDCADFFRLARFEKNLSDRTRSLKPKFDKTTPKQNAPKIKYALCERLDAQHGEDLCAAGRSPRKGNNLHGRHPNFSRLQVETSGANLEEPSTSRTVCDNRLSCSIRRTYTANQS